MVSPDQKVMLDVLEKQRQNQLQVDHVLKIVMPVTAFLLTVICANMNIGSTILTFVMLWVAFYAVGIKDKGIGIALKMEDGASSIVPYAILSVLTQLGVITPEEACSLPRYHDKNLYNNHHAVVGRTELAFQLEQVC